MTTSPTADAPLKSEPESEPRNRLDAVVGFASAMIHPSSFGRGDLAELRRMKPEAPDAAAFWRLLSSAGLLDLEMRPEVERKWGLILHGIALMTPTSGDDANSGSPRPSAHNPTVPVGLALFQGGDPNRSRAFYSEPRLNRLLTARGPMLHTLLARTFRMLGTNQPFNWRQMARLILDEGYGEESAEQARRRIARAYYQAKRRSKQAAQSAGD